MTNFNLADSRLTVSGEIKLLPQELGVLEDFLVAGDRGAFHLLYGLMSENVDSILTAQISTFSGSVGGAAFASNWLLQNENSGYPGIYLISQQIAEDIFDLVQTESEKPDGTGFLTVDEHFASAVSTGEM